ncbi:hypothetical protein GCM10029992_03500 [Glycomyces albus]
MVRRHDPASGTIDELADVGFAGTHLLPRNDLRRAIGLPYGERVWLRNRSDSWLRKRARAAHVLVALDSGAVYTVWRFAQRNRSAKAVLGLNPAVAAVRGLAEAGVSSNLGTHPGRRLRSPPATSSGLCDGCPRPPRASSALAPSCARPWEPVSGACRCGFRACPTDSAWRRASGWPRP